MSLLTFFAQQRKLWQSQSNDQSADHVAGGLTALNQAEAAFKALPIYNAYQQVADTQRELEEVSYQLVQARKEIKQIKVLENKLVQTTKKGSEVVVARQLVDNARLHRNRMRSALKVMRRVVEAVIDQSMQPDAKLEKILVVVRRFQATVHKGEEELGDESSLAEY